MWKITLGGAARGCPAAARSEGRFAYRFGTSVVDSGARPAT